MEDGNYVTNLVKRIHFVSVTSVRNVIHIKVFLAGGFFDKP